LTICLIAAAQLHQTSRSFFTQHFSLGSDPDLPYAESAASEVTRKQAKKNPARGRA
jgi:hypothetical protein